MSVTPLAWENQTLRLLDQTRLPDDEIWLNLREHRDVAEAIRSMRVRGAPAIGVAAAYGIALAALESDTPDRNALLAGLERAGETLEATRPTAINLRWAVRRVLSAVKSAPDADAIKARAEAEAMAIHREDVEANRSLGSHGAALLPPDPLVMTHCNAGALATAGYGTALGVVRAAAEAGQRVRVVATETRPLLQGARLTAWELAQDGIECTLIVDGAAATTLRSQAVDAVIVGADRVAANGDVANKIGTYAVALAAREHGVPFYVAAPSSSVDLSIASGDLIPIEERPGEEVLSVAGRAAPTGITASNPAFDVTPHQLISAIITERGVAREPYVTSLAEVLGAVGVAI
jgi:methylthioribose-1-phosphate isomerase